MITEAVLGDRYRFGFNGMENVDEISGRGSHIDFGARGYDPRRGQWLSVDPLAMSYPQMNPYNGIGNNPILNIDVDGRYILEHNYNRYREYTGVTMRITNVNSYKVINGLQALPAGIGWLFTLGKLSMSMDDPSVKFSFNSDVLIGGILSVSGLLAASKIKAANTILEVNRSAFSFLATLDESEYYDSYIDEVLVVTLEEKGFGKALHKSKFNGEDSDALSGFSFSSEYLSKVKSDVLQKQSKNEKIKCSSCLRNMIMEQIREDVEKVREDVKREVKVLQNDAKEKLKNNSE